MGANLDLSRDYLVFGDLKTVLLYRKISRTEYDGGTLVEHVHRNQAVEGDVSPGGSLLANRSTFFHFWRRALDDAGFTGDPKPGDVIEHGAEGFEVFGSGAGYTGERFTIDEVQHCDLDANGVQRYRCKATRE